MISVSAFLCPFFKGSFQGRGGHRSTPSLPAVLVPEQGLTGSRILVASAISWGIKAWEAFLMSLLAACAGKEKPHSAVQHPIWYKKPYLMLGEWNLLFTTPLVPLRPPRVPEWSYFRLEFLLSAPAPTLPSVSLSSFPREAPCPPHPTGLCHACLVTPRHSAFLSP